MNAASMNTPLARGLKQLFAAGGFIPKLGINEYTSSKRIETLLIGKNR